MNANLLVLSVFRDFIWIYHHKEGSGPHPGRHGTPPVTIDYVMDLSIPCVMYGHPVLRIVVITYTGNAVITIRPISSYRHAAAPQAENKRPLCIHLALYLIKRHPGIVA